MWVIRSIKFITFLLWKSHYYYYYYFVADNYKISKTILLLLLFFYKKRNFIKKAGGRKKKRWYKQYLQQWRESSYRRERELVKGSVEMMKSPVIVTHASFSLSPNDAPRPKATLNFFHNPTEVPILICEDHFVSPFPNHQNSANP